MSIVNINKNQIDILEHTQNRASNGFYCGDSEDMQGLIGLGLMESAGRKSFVPDEYFRMTDKGRTFMKLTT